MNFINKFNQTEIRKAIKFYNNDKLKGSKGLKKPELILFLSENVLTKAEKLRFEDALMKTQFTGGKKPPPSVNNVVNNEPNYVKARVEKIEGRKPVNIIQRGTVEKIPPKIPAKMTYADVLKDEGTITVPRNKGKDAYVKARTQKVDGKKHTPLTYIFQT